MTGQGACQGSPEDASCPVCELFDLFGRKWTIETLAVIGGEGTVRFNRLKRELDGITPRVLSDRLDQLVQEGLVERIDHETVPPRVEYALTEKGKDLERVFETSLEWASRWGKAPEEGLEKLER